VVLGWRRLMTQTHTQQRWTSPRGVRKTISAAREVQTLVNASTWTLTADDDLARPSVPRCCSRRPCPPLEDPFEFRDDTVALSLEEADLARLFGVNEGTLGQVLDGSIGLPSWLSRAAREARANPGPWLVDAGDVLLCEGSTRTRNAGHSCLMKR